MTFHINRRDYGYNAPATDIDFLEYDHFEPVLLWEAKSLKSHWRTGKRTAGVRASWRLAQRANIPFVVVEHGDDWSDITVCKVSEWMNNIPVISNEMHLGLQDFVAWLYEVRGRDIAHELPPNILLNLQSWQDRIPTHLQPIIFELKESEDSGYHD